VARSQIRQLITEFQTTAEARGKLLDFEFMNDAGYAQSPLRSYGKDSLDALKAAKEKWDPAAVFQKLQNSGFLLSRV
jgi:hypothetical protein